MTTTVYASTGGERYHRSPNCSALDMGQDLHDYDCDCLGQCHHGRGWRIEETTPSQAHAVGQTPCRVCFAGGVDLGPCEEDFGHEPVTAECALVGELPADPPVCARCQRTVRKFACWTNGYDERAGVQWEQGWITYQTDVPWPCGTAQLLGLAPAAR
ncbi:hypothetical protein [Streptomyces sp. NPDC051577]|uniref:hypothetical protein n=1 Tax=Streptomyces sp. NPDC051577 TaxID=3155166 RepID=UPI0034229549